MTIQKQQDNKYDIGECWTAVSFDVEKFRKESFRWDL